MRCVLILWMLLGLGGPATLTAASPEPVVSILAFQDTANAEETAEEEADNPREMSEFARLGTYLLVIAAVGLVAWLLAS